MGLFSWYEKSSAPKKPNPVIRKYRETTPDGVIFQISVKKCQCGCHEPGAAIIHFMDCCDMGFVHSRKEVVPLGYNIRKRNFNLVVPNSFYDFIKTSDKSNPYSP